MLIPVLPAANVDSDYASKAYAACGALCITDALPPFSYTGKRIIADKPQSIEQAGDLLNQGVALVIVDANEHEAYAEAYPHERLVARVASFEEAGDLLVQGKSSNIQIRISYSESLFEKTKSFLVASPKLKLSLMIDASQTEAHLLELLAGQLHRAVKDRPVHLFAHIKPEALVEKPSPLLISPARCLINSLAPSDRPDGLIPTVVTDERGIALGLVYSNVESIMAMIGSGRGVYWSRSRSKLWRKGEESGAIQELLAVQTDCDQDCLRVSVFQRGSPPSFCHTNERTCWGEDRGISHLFRTLQERKINAPVGSYTARLYNDSKLLRDKLLEEAAELSEAVEGAKSGKDSKFHVEEETADVLYFALTACVAGGGSLLEVEKQLDKRSLAVKRRKGDAKQYRQEELEAKLKELAEAKRVKEG